MECDGHKVYMNGDYPAIWLNNKNVHVHIYVWEKYNGKVPKGMIVHHKDENKMNWDISNLECLTRAEHIRKHKDVVHRPGIKIVARKGLEEIEFESIELAAAYCGTYPCGVRRVFNGTQKKANGWIFERR